MAAASPVQDLQEEATCSICLEYYTDPVTTKCGHNFCRSCISACSEAAGAALPCPQCRELCPRGDLRANRQLQNMVLLVKNLSMKQERLPGEGLCEKHEEKLKLFCEEDEKLICVICRESSNHEQHKVHPAEEAAHKYKVPEPGMMEIVNLCFLLFASIHIPGLCKEQNLLPNQDVQRVIIRHLMWEHWDRSSRYHNNDCIIVMSQNGFQLINKEKGLAVCLS